VSMSGAVK